MRNGGEVPSRWTSDLSTSDAIDVMTSISDTSPAHSASASSRSNGPAISPSRSKTARSRRLSSSYDHSNVACSVWWRDVARVPLRAEQLEAVVEQVDEAGGIERPGLRRRQLDRQRQPVEPPAQLLHRSTVRRPVERRAALRGAAQEQAGRVAERRVGTSERQRGHAHDVLARQLERFAAGRQHVDVGRAGEDRTDGVARRIDEVFAVVDEQQHPPRPQRVVDEHVHRDRRRRQPERVGEAGHDRPLLADLTQLDEPDTVGVPTDASTGLDRQGGLADPAHADQADEPVLPERGDDLGQRGRAPDELDEPFRQVAGHLDRGPLRAAWRPRRPRWRPSRPRSAR